MIFAVFEEKSIQGSDRFRVISAFKSRENKASSSSYRLKSLALLPFAKTDRKWKSAMRGAYYGKLHHSSIDRLRFPICVQWTYLLVQLLPFRVLNGILLEAEIGDRWRRQAGVLRSSDKSTRICSCVNIPRQAPAI
jgi:hypothetical protein